MLIGTMMSVVRYSSIRLEQLAKKTKKPIPKTRKQDSHLAFTDINKIPRYRPFGFYLAATCNIPALAAICYNSV